MLLTRYSALAVAIITLIVSGYYLPHVWAIPMFIVAAALTCLGLYDLTQPIHSVRRNYPIIGHLRWFFEEIRPEIRQYMIEGDQDKIPFSRSQRSLVYARAKDEVSDRAFGTLLDVYEDGYEFIAHSVRPAPPTDPAKFRLRIGGQSCTQPYSSSILNISAMSFGSLSANAIRALNKGAALGGFAHDTGEGSISPYHREADGDLIWEIGSGYFGCRTADGNFDPIQFEKQARNAQVKMIEVKLSQGAKPGHGGILPAEKVTPEISQTRGVPTGEDCISPARHRAFATPLEFMHFLSELRRLSGGKLVGFKLCVGQPWEFMGIVKAMRESGILPDFIVVDGAEGGTGASPAEFIDHLGMPLREGLLFVHNTLVGAGLRKQIRIGAAGKIVSAFDIAATLALGADWTNSGRGFMFALGCIQSLTCHTNRCPVGVATQDPLRQRALVVPDKAERVANFHRNTLLALSDMLAAAGLAHPSMIGPHHLVRRVSPTEVRMFSQLHTFLEDGDLLRKEREPDFYSAAWRLARADSFSIGQ
ncbi:FMN-binding glutamate synthase family protein [Novosphingobium sp. JCM 18896]|uniref:FMN-binding glutamate synthase family protein n=1 Tax=Novosphingobium sp. JCM 18896 TaxID=2989731 RepID=UPI002221F59C|nr:FMN-binding glutamate synthase family protein [Novosphingobium sp. JCM 18896]MCW1432478.1 FMN-binding glutamate synthase family protein [Novosphingobium sp. JCM 18896]